MKKCQMCKIEFQTTQWEIRNKCVPCLQKIANNKKIRSIQKKPPKRVIWRKKFDKEQADVHKIIRERDKGLPCISCGKQMQQHEMQAGHYIARSRCVKLRQDERNIHGQCFKCNITLHGNRKLYRIGLINRFSIEFVEELEKIEKEVGTITVPIT